ncbi:MAG: DUF4349 domain-containing protein [Clostridia bacterium]|nr:DUF4349 domain-containing protein [Deltaproteobacteria bacterium]
MSPILLTLVLATTAIPELPAASNPSPRIAIGDSIVVKVGDRQKAADAVIAAAEAADGYFTSRTDEAIHLRVPSAKESEVLAVAMAQGIVVGRAHTANDLTSSIEEQRSLLESRRNVLDRYFAVLATAKASSVSTVEHQMTELIQEIEELQGLLRLEEHNLGFADLEVSFQFRDRSAPTNDGRSSFKWLNGMNLGELLGDFQHEIN